MLTFLTRPIAVRTPPALPATRRSDAFTPAAVGARMSTRLHIGGGGVDYLSQIHDGDEERRRAEERDKELEGIRTQADAQGTASSMANFVDFAEGFDGGDGQVGVVGDGSNHMEEFDTRAQVNTDAASTNVMMAKDLKSSVGDSVERSKLVQDSKATQVLSFGSEGTGYRDVLKERGMVDIDKKTGEDRLKVRRQQLENWHQQNDLRGAQRQRINDMNMLEGGAAFAERQSGKGGVSRGYFDQLSGDAGVMNRGPDPNDPFADIQLGGGGGSMLSDFKKENTISFEGGVQPGPAMHTTEHAVAVGTYKIYVKNPTMAFQDYTCGFTADSHPSFTVTPDRGTLERRNAKEATELTVIYKPSEMGDHRAVLVVKTKARTWTHVLNGSTGTGG